MAEENQGLEQLIAEARASAGAERANYQLFVSGLCAVFGQPRPSMTRSKQPMRRVGISA